MSSSSVSTGKTNIIKQIFSEISPAKVLLFASAGLAAGTTIGLVSESIRTRKEKKQKLGIDVPNMALLDPELVSFFSKFSDTFLKICPEKNKKLFKEYLEKSIINAEAVMLIEVQLLKNEIQRTSHHKNQVNAHAFISINTLRKIINLYDTDFMFNVRDSVDIIYVYLANHTNNVKLLTSQ